MRTNRPILLYHGRATLIALRNPRGLIALFTNRGTITYIPHKPRFVNSSRGSGGIEVDHLKRFTASSSPLLDPWDPR